MKNLNFVDKSNKYQRGINNSLMKIIIFCSILLISSCISQKKIKYIQDDNNLITSLPSNIGSENVIKPQDELFIRVSSLDDKAVQLFNSIDFTRSGSFSTNLQLITYTVTDSGTIDFPILGKIHVENFTLSEAKEILYKELKKYVNEPTVTIKFLNRFVNILGEVNRPGRYNFDKEKINIFEAVALAGDITIYGNRNKVTIIRQEKDTTTFNYIDVTNKNIVASQFYYLKPNDIVYIEPIQAKSLGIRPTAQETILPYITLLSSVVSLILILSKL